MAQLGYAFDPSQAPQNDRNFEPLPTGWYAAQCVESDVVPTKAGTGLIAKFTWEILDGPFSGRKVWQNINVQNQNAQAQEIGQRDLAEICRALGLGPITDTSVVHFKPLQIRVGVQKDDKERNEVKGFKAYGGAGAPAQSQPQGGQGQQPQYQQQPQGGQPAAGGSRPWSR